MPEVWTDSGVVWNDFDAVIVRATWDYCDKFEQFNDWVSTVARQTRIVNSEKIISWNCKKLYLLELAGRGIPIPETIYLKKGSKPDLRAILNSRGWREAVIKPIVGATARLAMRFTIERHSAASAHLAKCLHSEDMILQPFLPEVLESGELSLIFAGLEFSHAVVKRPAPGDYRVQSEHKGSTEPAAGDREIVALARRIISCAPEVPAFARVDLILTKSSGPLLVELELIEPELYFRPWPGSEAKMADALIAYLTK